MGNYGIMNTPRYKSKHPTEIIGMSGIFTAIEEWEKCECKCRMEGGKAADRWISTSCKLGQVRFDSR